MIIQRKIRILKLCLWRLLHLSGSKDLIIFSSQMPLINFCCNNGKQDSIAALTWCLMWYCSHILSNSFAMLNLWVLKFFIKITSVFWLILINIFPQAVLIYMRKKLRDTHSLNQDNTLFMKIPARFCK